MKRKIFFLLSVMLLTGLGTVYAQGLSVSGVVTDAGDGSPVPGVSVLIKGSTKGTMTDASGKYAVKWRHVVVLYAMER